MTLRVNEPDSLNKKSQELKNKWQKFKTHLVNLCSQLTQNVLRCPQQGSFATRQHLSRGSAQTRFRPGIEDTASDIEPDVGNTRKTIASIDLAQHIGGGVMLPIDGSVGLFH